MNKMPWTDYPIIPRDRYKGWDAETYPFVVRWSVSYPDRLTRWITHNREFTNMAEAVAAYKRPFAGLSVDLVMYNGKPAGQHLDTLARRKATKPTKWSEQVPVELR